MKLFVTDFDWYARERVVGCLRSMSGLRKKAAAHVRGSNSGEVVGRAKNTGGAMGHSEGLHRRSFGLTGLPERTSSRDGLRGGAGL